MTNDFKGSGQTTYDGPDNEEDYIKWVKSKYGDVPSRFPPASIVCFENDPNHEYAVVGYVKYNDLPTVKLIDLAEMATTPYEAYNTKSKTICPEHELPKLRYLYNQNGEELTAKFRDEAPVAKPDPFAKCRNAITYVRSIEQASCINLLAMPKMFGLNVDVTLNAFRKGLTDMVKTGKSKDNPKFAALEANALLEIETPEFRKWIESRLK